MTEIAGITLSEQIEDLSWDLTPPHGGFVQQATLDVSLWTQAQHFPNGYIPSGAIVGIKTTGGKAAPYLDANADGTQAAVGILRHSVQVVNPNGSLKTLIGVALLVHGIVSVARLPFVVGNAAAGGYIDANGKTDLKLIYFAA